MARHCLAFLERRPFLDCKFAWIAFVFLSLTIAQSAGQDDLISLCRSTASRQSCGQCIKQSPECVWCTDPAFAGDYRCDVESNLIDSCPPQFLYQAKSNVRVKENVEAGLYEQNVGRIRRIQPQVVHLFIKPGESVNFPLKYYHSEEAVQDITVLNSETESHGVSLTYSVDCKGQKRQDRVCHEVRNADLITYNVTVSIRGCSSNAVISIGITNVREVTAVYVHPQCGCDCERPEKQEPQSAHCSGTGNLVCGACLCNNPRLGGRHCECPLAEGQTTAQLEDYCRPSPDKPICSGHGYCNCGYCICDQQYSGRFCDCSYTPCPLADNGQQCGGRGTCHCGACQCEPGWEGPTCTCSVGTDDCLSVDGKICSGRGRCYCNKCTCLEGSDGEQCERDLSGGAGGGLVDHHPSGGTSAPGGTTETGGAHPTDDDGDDQDDDDDDDDQDGGTTGTHDETTAGVGGDENPDTVHPDDDQQQPIDGAHAEPEPEPEPSAGDHADDGTGTGGGGGNEGVGQSPEDPTAASRKESDAAGLASSNSVGSFLACFLSFLLLALVSRR